MAAACLLVGSNAALAQPHRRLLGRQPALHAAKQQAAALQAAGAPTALTCDEFELPSTPVVTRAGVLPTTPAKRSPVAAAAWTDDDAGWISSSPSTNQPKTWVFYYAAVQSSGAQSATVQYAAQAAATLTLNGELVNTREAGLWSWMPSKPRYTTVEVTLQPGRNVLMIGAVNYGNGQGVIASLTSGTAASGGVLLLDTSAANAAQWSWTARALQYLCTAAGTPPAPPLAAVTPCAASELLLVQDYGTGMCLHVTGQRTVDGWTFPGSGHRVATEPCAGPSNPSAYDNQAWDWNAPYLTHEASGMNLATATQLVQDGTFATMAAPSVDGSRAGQQQWEWESFGLMKLASNTGFALTDARATSASVPGQPVHLWQPDALPGGAVPSANWAQVCVPGPAQ